MIAAPSTTRALLAFALSVLAPQATMAQEAFFAAIYRAIGERSADAVHRVAAFGEPFYAGRFADALRLVRSA